MIFNTYPINDFQPVPSFVKNFYSDLRHLIINSDKNYEEPADAVLDLLYKNGLSASISLNAITVNDWDDDNEGSYLILCWRDINEQHDFIQYYKDFEVTQAPQPSASYRH